jgi:hypothetical protein
MASFPQVSPPTPCARDTATHVPKLELTATKQRRSLTHGDFFSTINFRTQIPAIFSEIFGNYCSTSTSMFNYSTISRETSEDLVRNPGCETGALGESEEDTKQKLLKVRKFCGTIRALLNKL